METKVEALQDNKVKVTVTVDAKEVDNRIKKAYKDFANKYNFPGFRKGKAPRPIIDNALGAEAVPASVTDDIVNGSLSTAAICIPSASPSSASLRSSRVASPTSSPSRSSASRPANSPITSRSK